MYKEIRNILGIPWWSSSSDSALPMQGAWVRSLARELRFHVLHDAAKERKNEKVFKKTSINYLISNIVLW